MNSDDPSSTPPRTARPWAKAALDVDPVQIMTALERGFPVRLIGTFEKLVTCRLGDPLDIVVDRADAEEFDYLPVLDGDKIVGLLNRRAIAEEKGSSGKEPEKLVKNAYDPLDESNIITADAGILLFLLNATTSPCRLVLAADRVTGLVCKSDLQKLPVRALLFHVLTHLELVMAAWIRDNFSDETAWLSVLPKSDCKGIEKQYSALKKSNLAIDRLTATTFAEKRTVLLMCGEFSSQAEEDFERIRELRNRVAHIGDYALIDETADRMIETVALAQSWIEALPNLAQKSNT